MSSVLRAALLWLGVGFAQAAPLRVNAEHIDLQGPAAGYQLLVSQDDSDITRAASYQIDPADVVAIDDRGYIRPLKDGLAKIAVTHADVSITIAAEVSSFSHTRPVSFRSDVMPIFTRHHCNAGACHAKKAGQNDFGLSLFGFDPEYDYREIVREARGRRIMRAAPAHSLLLQKPSGDLPHEGGARFTSNSPDYQTLRRWIAEGARFRNDSDPELLRIEIQPATAIIRPQSAQQLAVTAFFSDGRRRDITHMAQYESNQPDMAGADERGLVSIAEKSGRAAIMVRFLSHISVFTATIPLGHPLPELPAPTTRIDRHISAQWQQLGLPPSPLTDDSSFLRRVSLAIAGRLPTLAETQTFVADGAPNKRAQAIDRLLDSSEYADFFAGKWASILRNKSASEEHINRDTHAFHAWIRSRLIENQPYDRFIAELILASGRSSDHPAVSWYRAVSDPKERMQDVAQIFLGIRMACAQCHHHPYEKWSMDDYFSFAAFFSTLKEKKIPKLPESASIYHSREPAQWKQPVSEVMLKPRLPGATEPLAIPDHRDPRLELAQWIRSPENPYVATVLVNRYWRHFFGRGLVEPEDDIRVTNPATHPALLSELAASFVASGYDLKQLIREICNSRSYQLSAVPNAHNAADEQNFARYYTRRLPAEVLLDAINDVTGSTNSFRNQPTAVRAIALPNESANKESAFLTMFGRPQMDTACECERSSVASLGQSLHLINADSMQKKLADNSGTAATLAKAKDRSDDERLSDLYLRALARPPTASELALAKSHLAKKRNPEASEKTEREAFEDILWVILNTKEFLFNH